MNLNNFPYDSQNCYLKFGSWSYSEKYLIINTNKHAINFNFSNNNECDLINNKTNINSIKYNSQIDKYYDITYDFIFKRNHSYYEINIIFPIFSISFLILITLIIHISSGKEYHLYNNNVIFSSFPFINI